MAFRRRVRGALLAAAPLMAMLAGPMIVPPLAAAATPVSMLFVDTAWGYSVDGGKVRSIVSPDEGVLQANSSSYGTAAGVGAVFAVTPTDTTEDGSSWTLEFEAPPGQTLVPGTYTGGSAFYDRAPGVSYFDISQSSCSSATAVSTFTIYEASFNGDGVPTAFAASFVERCGAAAAYEPRVGEIRFNSTVGIRARDITPVDGHDFPVTDEGVESATKSVTVTNTGTLALHPAAAVPDAHLVVKQNCPTSLAVGASCNITFASRPTLPGWRSAWLTVVDDSIAGTHEVHATVKGRAVTTTALTSSNNPDIYPFGSGFVATISPAPPNSEGGRVQFYIDGVAYGPTVTVTGGKATKTYTGGRSGTRVFTAQFTGTTYYQPSVSNAIDQASVEAPVLNLYVSPVQGPPEQPVLIVTSIARYPGSTLEKGGTVELTDELTGETLATFGMADPTPKKAICPSRLTPGTHRIRVTYSGYGDIIAATKYVDVVVGAGLSITPGTFDPSGSSVIRCATFRTLDEAYVAPAGWLTTVNVPTITTILGGVATRPIANVRISNSGTLSGGLLQQGVNHPYGSAFEFSLIDPLYGGVDADGHHTVWWQLQTDDNVWHPPYSVTLVLDRAAPSGTVSIASGASFAGGTAVTLAVPATDAVAGLAQVALSNDGTTWTTRAYGPSQPWTLTGGDGTKTVRVKWKDLAGNWSTVKTDTIVLDTVAPAATAPSKAFVAASVLSGTSMPTKFTWAGTDATSGIARYEAAISTDGGAYSTISTNLLTATLTRNLASGHTYRLRIRAVDKAGLIGSWTYGTTFTVSAFQETSSRITYGGTWKRPASTSYWGGYERYATAAGAKATFSFTGRAFAWTGCVGPTRGSARIYVNGVLVATVSTYASTSSCKKVLYAASWSSSVSRKISIVVRGTAGHPRVDLDALVTAT